MLGDFVSMGSDGWRVSSNGRWPQRVRGFRAASIIPLLVILLGFGSSPAVAKIKGNPRCSPVPGAQSVLLKPGLKFVLFSEVHGTEESPELFGDAVCSVLRSGRKVVVAIEWPRENQGLIEDYLASEGGAEAKIILLSSPAWRDQTSGKSSQAMLKLIDRLRALRAEGLDLKVTTFFGVMLPGDTGQTEVNARMAKHLIDAGARSPGALVMALTGFAHGARSTPASSFLSMATAMPHSRTVTLGLRGWGGEAWPCRSSGIPALCLRTGAEEIPRGIGLLHGPSAQFDGYYSVGKPLRSSPPAAPAD
jgi:hypothetical protein